MAGGYLGGLGGSFLGNAILGPVGSTAGALLGSGVLDNGVGDKISKGFGNIAGSFGAGSGVAGTNFAGPTAGNPNIVNPTNSGQVAQANQMGMGSVAQQQALLQALQNQNGFGAQNNALMGQTNLSGQLAGVGGVGNQNAAYGAQQGLANQLGQSGGLSAQQNALNQQRAMNQALSGGVNAQNQALSGLQNVGNQQAALGQQYQNIANGTGPNPAQAALNQATGQNVANQAALMASQRGAGANIGLLARQAAQQGAATQQQAVGQGATMQAQQEMNALSGLSANQQAQAATQGQIGQLGSTQAGMQQTGIGQLASQGQTLTGEQQAALAQQASQAQAQVAAQQQALAQQANQANVLGGQQIAGQQAATQAAQNEQAAQLGAQQGFNTIQGGLQQNVNNNNQALAQTQMGTQKGLFGGLLSGGAQALGAAGFADGGEVMMAEGGQMDSAPVVQESLIGPQSSFARFLNSIPQQSEVQTQPNAQTSDDKSLNQGASSLGSALTSAMMAKGGKVKDLKNGGNVKASSSKEKAKVKGNSYSNDTIPALLSEGEVVIPRNIMMSKDPATGAAQFVAKVLAKRGRKYG